MDGLEGKKNTQGVVTEYMGGFNGPTVFNGAMSRLQPGLTFKDAVPSEVKQMLNFDQAPKAGQMLDSWVTRRPNGQK